MGKDELPRNFHGDRALLGVISDTHGLLRPEVCEVFRGMDLILHAGDIGKPEVLHALRQVAPVLAVRGNNDLGRWADTIPETETVEIRGSRIFLVHDLKSLSRGPRLVDFQVVISGHSHRPSLEQRKGTLFLNPGSAGPRRFRLPVTVARLTLTESSPSGELIDLVDVPGN